MKWQYQHLLFGQLYRNYILKYVENENFLERLPLAHSSMNEGEHVFVAFDGVKIIAIVALTAISDVIMEGNYSIVDENYRAQGIAKFLKQKKYEFLAKNKLVYINSPYSPLGQKHLKKINEQYANEYQLLFFEYHENYEEVMKTFNRETYTWDKELKEKLKNKYI